MTKDLKQDDSAFIFSFITLARKGRNGKKLEDRLSSVLIYGNLAEFLAENFLEWIRLETNLIQMKNKSNFSISKSKKNESTNLEQSLRKLKMFDFPIKKDILIKLEKIKNNRNTLFHNLLKSKEKNIDYDGLIKIIQDDTEDLFRLWDKFHQVVKK